MSNVLKALLSGGGASPLYVDDVFVSYPRTGTGADVPVTTGIDMTKGYMLWSKGRSGATDHAIYDSARGVTYDLVSNSTAAQTTQATGLKAVSSTGHTVGSLAKMNTSAATYVDFVFRKAPKFFDVVTYTGNNTTQVINHSLGVVPGMVIVKKANSTGAWYVWHSGLTAGNYIVLNTTAAQTTASAVNLFGDNTSTVNPTATNFTVGNSGSVNSSVGTYVAYLFAHDTSTDGIVQCGSFTTDGSGNATVNLGWEPQFILYKATTSGTPTGGAWRIMDNMRGLNSTVTANAGVLNPNTSGAEGSGYTVGINSTGFASGGQLDSSTTYIYLAIRRPNKPPTSGTQVYNAIARTGTGAAATVTGVGFAPDLVIPFNRPQTYAYGASFYDRLRGADKQLIANSTVAESTSSSALTGFDSMDGVKVGTDVNGVINLATTYINYFFRRATGVFDVVCWTAGTASNRRVSHNLTVAPELIINKARSTAQSWYSYSAATGRSNYLALDSSAGVSASTNVWGTSDPTTTDFGINEGILCVNNATYVSYLFASKEGISKIGSYTGNGGSQTINCGFSAGARFVLIKRTDSTGDWFIWDTVRGIVAGNDPHLSLNTTAAEVTTDDSIDPDNSGFIVNQLAATNININGAEYLYLAYA